MSARAKGPIESSREKKEDACFCVVLRAFGHPGGCVPGREGPEAGGSVEGGCFHLGRLAAGGPT